MALHATATAASALLIAGVVGIFSTVPPMSPLAAVVAPVLVMGGVGNPRSTPPNSIDHVRLPGRSVFNRFRFEEPIEVTREPLVAVPTQLDNGVEVLAGVHPFGTDSASIGAVGSGASATHQNGAIPFSGTSGPAQTRRAGKQSNPVGAR